MLNRNVGKAAIAALLSTTLISCGGGGGGPTNSTNPPEQPQDTTAPVITLLGDDSVTIELGKVYNDEGATASDNVDGDITNSIETVNSVDSSAVGSYTVTYNVSDTAGNQATEVIRTVSVFEPVPQDNIAPVITLLGDHSVTIELNEAYTDAGATALDNVDGDLTDKIEVVNSVNNTSVGTYSVTYNVVDAAGNHAMEVTRSVSVVEPQEQDTIAPVITLLGSASVTIAVGENYIDAGATALDNVDGDVTDNIVTVNSVNNTNAGSYTVTFNVTDTAGNQASEVTRTVNVVERSTWGQYEYLKEHIQNAQAATVKITNSSATMINEKFAITAAHSPMDENYEVTPNLTVTNIFGEVRDVINVFYTAEEADFAVVELASPFENSYSVKVAAQTATTGDDIFGVGHPAQGLDWAVTFGKAVNNITDGGIQVENDLYATAGFSGGGVYNNNGELITVISGGGAGGSITNEFVPPFSEAFEVRNNVIYPTEDMEVRTKGPAFDLIVDFLNDNNIPDSVLVAGGNALPNDPIDPISIADTGYVQEEVLASVANIAQQSRHSTVSISHDNAATYDNFWSSGTGVIIADDLILTVGHIVDEDYINHVSIMFSDGTVYNDNVEVAFSMEETQFGAIDLALIRINGSLPSSAVIAELAESELEPEQHAYFVGNPSMLWRTEGGWHVVAAENRGIVFGNDDGVEYDFNSQPLGGFSGSGIFNLEGKVISILHGGGCNGIREEGIFNMQDPHGAKYSPIEGECSTKGTRLDIIKRFIEDSGLMK